jgi:hypothetical protein
MYMSRRAGSIAHHWTSDGCKGQLWGKRVGGKLILVRETAKGVVEDEYVIFGSSEGGRLADGFQGVEGHSGRFWEYI